MTPENVGMSPAGRRRWFQFGISAVLLLIAILALPLGWLARKIQVKHERAATKKWISERGGVVMPGAANARRVRLPSDMTDAEREAARRVFPEADVQVFDP